MSAGAPDGLHLIKCKVLEFSLIPQLLPLLFPQCSSYSLSHTSLLLSSLHPLLLFVILQARGAPWVETRDFLLDLKARVGTGIKRGKGFVYVHARSFFRLMRCSTDNWRKLLLKETHIHTPWPTETEGERAQVGAREKGRERARERERKNMKQLICKGVNHGKPVWERDRATTYSAYTGIVMWTSLFSILYSSLFPSAYLNVFFVGYRFGIVVIAVLNIAVVVVVPFSTLAGHCHRFSHRN